MVNTITINKNMFNILKEKLKPLIKDNCDFCKVKVTKDNFGYVDRDVTCCKSILCLIEKISEDNP